MQLPQKLYNAAHRLAGELAWPAAEARQVVNWLNRQRREIVGAELWREKDGQPQWVASSDFSPASDQSAMQFIKNCQNEPGALFNLTWLEPDKGKFDNYTRVRLLTDRFRVEGANLFDIGYIIEVYPGGKYEVEFSDSMGISYAQIVANAGELRLDEPESHH